MNWIDGISIIAIVVFAIRGAMRGAIWQLAAVATVALAIAVTSQLAPVVQDQLPEAIEPQYRPWVAMGAIYLGLSFVVFLGARILRGWFEKARFVEFDRHWGAIIGAVKGVLIVLAVAVLVAVFIPTTRSLLRESRTGIVAKFCAQTVAPMLPDWARRAIETAFDELPIDA